MIRRIHYLHSKGIVHREVKSNNFMFGKFSNTMDYIIRKFFFYIIYFGLNKGYISIESGEHLPFKD